MIKKHWWKALGVLILLYTFTVGLLVPLKPGIMVVNPASARTGEQLELSVEGYNSNFTKAPESIRAWLKMDDDTALAADKVEVLSDVALEVAFTIPEYLPADEKVKDFTLWLDNSVDGTSVMPSAVFITQDSIDPEMGKKSWVNASIDNLSPREGMTFPFRTILEETIRNTYYHVPFWMAMFVLFTVASIFSIRYLRGFKPKDDFYANAFTSVGLLYGVIGLLTGAVWAKHTWGAYWSWDIKQNMTAIALLIYFAYFILRNSFEDMEKRSRIAAVYNIFAFASLVPLLYVIPRMESVSSLHPGAGGNIAFGSQDLDNTMRMVFYPAIIGWTLMGVWIANLILRAAIIKEKLFDI